MSTANKTLYLIDGHGFIFRAFHALPPLTRPDGTPVGAVMGFCNMLLRVLEEAGNAHIAVVFDPKGGNFRHQLYPEYKANRTEPPEDLVPQFALVREATVAFGIEGLEQTGFEADDLIATYTREAVERGYEVRIISSDKDLMQLIRDGVRLVDPIKFTLLGPDDVMAKFGVTPEKVVDVQALAGDSTDNVPGVPGIGVKTAAELINLYGDVETLLANTNNIKQPKRRETLEQNAKKALISKQLVSLDAHAPMPKPFDVLLPHSPDLSRLSPFLQTQGFRSLISRVEKKWGHLPHAFLDEANASLVTPPIPSLPNNDVVIENYELITTEVDLDRWIALIRQNNLVAVDTETDSLTPANADLVGICLSVTPGHACYIPVGHKAQAEDLFSDTSKMSFDQLDKKLVIEKLKPVLEDVGILKIAHNMKYDWQILANEGIRVTPFDDTMVMSYILDGGKHGHGLDELGELHLGKKLIAYNDVTGKGKNKKTFDQLTPQDVKDYSAEDADVTLRLYHILAPRIAAEKQSALYHEVDKPIIQILAEMESIGITVDSKVLQKLSAEFEEKMQEAEKKVFEQAGEEFNLGSPKQLGDILFNNLGLPGGKATKTGAYSTDAKTLEELSLQGHAIVDDILEWRQLAKLRSTYTEALQEQINDRTGRVHTSFGMASTNTGRLSSTDPNLQNIPIRTEEGRMIRKAFVAVPGHKLISADYSQIELRLIADMAGIKRLQQAFHDNVDIHTLTASEVFGVKLEDVTSEIRRAAKAINFGIIYGISGFGLGKQLNIPPGEANAYIKLYMERFPELRAYMDATKKFARDHGYVVTTMGRRCFVPGIQSKNGAERAFAERQAINAPLQGTAADIMKMAMHAVDRDLKAQNLPARILLQVHDELVLEVEEKAVDLVGITVKKAMENVVTLGVPLIAEWGVGPNWDEAH